MKITLIAWTLSNMSLLIRAWLWIAACFCAAVLLTEQAECSQKIDNALSWLKKQSSSWQLESFPDDMAKWDADHYIRLNAALYSIVIVPHSLKELPPAVEALVRGFYTRHTKAPLAVRLCLMNATIVSWQLGYRYHSTTEIMTASDGGDVYSKLAQAAGKANVSFLPGPVCVWAAAVCASTFNPRNLELEKWERFLRTSLTFDSLTISSNIWDPLGKKTPLLALVQGVAMHCSKLDIKHIPKIMANLHQTLLRWVSLLVEIGIDIVAYGKWEAQELGMLYIHLLL
jgi:hypothetical protein